MTLIVNQRGLLSRALDAERQVVAAVRPGDLDRPTPCAGWALRDLLAHLVGQHHGFAAAVRHGDADAGAFAPRPPSADADTDALLADWQASVDALVDAFAVAPPERAVRLVELSADRRFPQDVVAGFQLLDTVVHTWDLARTLGRDHRPDADLLAAVGRVAEQVPDGEARRRPGAAFAPAVTTSDRPGGAPAAAPGDPWVRVLALLGRAA